MSEELWYVIVCYVVCMLLRIILCHDFSIPNDFSDCFLSTEKNVWTETAKRSIIKTRWYHSKMCLEQSLKLLIAAMIVDDVIYVYAGILYIVNAVRFIATEVNFSLPNLRILKLSR